MFNHILMPTDGSEHSERAVERGIELAKLCGAKVTGIHVMRDHLRMIAYDESIAITWPDKADAEQRALATGFLAFVQKTAVAAGVSCDTVVATNARPYDAIVRTANERGCDLIVMTSRYRRGLVSLIMGNESTHVLHRASIPVLTFRALMSVDHPDRTVPESVTT